MIVDTRSGTRRRRGASASAQAGGDRDGIARLTVDLPTMAGLHDQDYQPVIVDGVKDAVVELSQRPQCFRGQTPARTGATSRLEAEFRPDLFGRYRLRACLDFRQRLARCLHVRKVLQQLAELLRNQALQFGRQLSRDDRSEPLAVLSEIDDLTARSIMCRVGNLARCRFERNLTHVTTVRRRSSSYGELQEPSWRGLRHRPGGGEDNNSAAIWAARRADRRGSG